MVENYEGLPPEIEKLSERLAKDPKSLVFSSLANAYRKNNMIDEAIEILQKGLEIHSNYASARIVLGRCYIDKRMYEMAKVEFKKALKSDPQNIVVLEKLAEIYRTLNQTKEAHSTYKKLLELDPLNEDFGREVESLKVDLGEIASEVQEYKTLRTIPEKKEEEIVGVERTEEKQFEDITTIEDEETSEAPSLSEIFQDAPDIPEEPSPESHELEEDKKEEEPNHPTPSFSEMFEEPSPASEKPSDTIEKAIPISIEVPPEKEKVREEVSPIDLSTLTKGKTADVEPPKEQEPPEEIEQVETISTVFEESAQKAAQDLLEEEPPKTEEIVPELIKETEKKEATVPTKEPEKPEEKAATMEEKKEKPTATETLAEIYLTQGFLEEALNIYRELSDADPENEKLKIKIEELEKQSLSEQKPQEQTIQEEPSIEGESPQQTSEEKPSIDTKPQEPTQEEKRDQSKNLDNFQDWLKKFQK